MNKGYKLETQQFGNYLYFRVEGSTSYETAVELWKEIGRTCNELGFKSIFVDENLKGQVSPQDMIRITSRFKEFGLAKCRIAFLDREPSHGDGNELGETIVASLGINVRIFTSQEEAIAWISKDSKDE